MGKRVPEIPRHGVPSSPERTGFARGAQITRQKYSEAEFMACLLVCGVPVVDGRVTNHAEYWRSVDTWFFANYPQRWLNLLNLSEPYTHGQMHFKAAFFDWYVAESKQREKRKQYESTGNTLRLEKK